MDAHYRSMSRRVESKSFLFIELNHTVLDKTLYLLSLVSFVSLLVKPIAKQDRVPIQMPHVLVERRTYGITCTRSIQYL